MNDTGLLSEELEWPRAGDSSSLDVGLDSGSDSVLSDDTLQSENDDRASCHGQSIPSGNLSSLSLLETESGLLCSRSHTTIHPAYKELRETRIRLLKILPIQADRAIHCRLEEFSLDDEPTYTAISYTWGSQHGTHAVFVNDHSLLVPKNLWRFLDSARAVGGDLSSWLWIDMLSINQADIPERGHQVSLMPVIFRTASLVNVWLGPTYLGSDEALIALSRSSNHWKSLSQRRKVWASNAGPGIRELCQRPYWTRLWVYQELRLARKIQLMCGRRTIEWDQFRLFLSLAETDLSANIPRLSSFVQDSVDSPAMRMVKLNSKSVNTHLWSLIHATQYLRCSDIRDKAYALLGASTQGHENIKPDYAIPIPTLINQILLEVYELYPPESLEEALARCNEVEDALAVPRGTVFTIRGQRGNYEVPSEADFRACRLGPQATRLNLWWTAFYGHLAVQRLLLSEWQAEYFANDPSVGESQLTWKATAVARNLFRTCAMETLSLDPLLSQYSSSFQSRYDAVESALLAGKFDTTTDQPLPQIAPGIQVFGELVRSMAAGGTAHPFRILLAPGGILASEDDSIVDLLRACAIHHDAVGLLLRLQTAGFVDDVTESRFFRSANPPANPPAKDPFLGIDAERISCYHHRFFNTPHKFPQMATTGKSPKKVVRLPLLSYLASRPRTRCIYYFRRHPNCDMDVQDENGWTPLIWAARYNSKDYVSLVLSHRKPLCDVNYSDPNGWTAFEHAAAFSNTHIMSMILDTKGFEHNAMNPNGRTRLLEAIENCDVCMAAMLLKQEICDPNVQDNTGRTPLTLAVSAWPWTSHLEDATAVSRLQSSATEPENSDYMEQAKVRRREQGEYEQERLVALLLRRRDTDVNLQDASCRSALMIASTLGSVNLVKRLLRIKGCDRNLVAYNGDTARGLALISGHMEIVRLLEDDSYPSTSISI
jgi:hypothetical protein